MAQGHLPSAQEMIARLDRLPSWPYPKSMLVVIAIGFFFSFYDITSIGLALPVITQQFAVTTQQAVWTVTLSLIGYIVGSLMDSRLSDLFGRKLALVVSVLLFSGGSIMSATSSSLTQLMVWRFVIGMGIGAEIANVVTYIGELSPAAIRGKITAICVAVSMVGFAFVPFIAMWLVPHYPWGWRLLFFIGGCGGFTALLIRLFLPESMRWLISQQQYHRAYKSLLSIEARIERQMGAMLLKPSAAVVEESITVQASVLKYRYVVLFALVWVFYYIGNYAWLTLNTKLFTLIGFNLSNSLLLVGLTSFGFVVGSFVAIACGDRFERKWVCVGVCFAWGLLLMVIALHPTFNTIMCMGFLAACAIGFTIPVMYTYTAEHFPTTIRATCLAITDGLGHVGGAFCGQFAFAFYALFGAGHAGFAAAFIALGLTGWVTALVLLFADKKTRLILQQ